MSRHDPQLYLSELDKKILSLLSRLLLDSFEAGPKSNRPDDKILLNDNEATELLSLLEKLTQTKSYQEDTLFIDSLLSSDAESVNSLRKAYQSIRARRGRMNVKASARWVGFLKRFGRNVSAENAKYLDSDVIPMKLQMFFSKEEKLFNQAGIHPRIINVLMTLIRAQEKKLEQWRRDPNPDDRVRVKAVLPSIVRELQHSIENSPLNKTLSVVKACSAIALIVNLGVLFTTRDWDVVGGLSTMASYGMDLKKDRVN